MVLSPGRPDACEWLEDRDFGAVGRRRIIMVPRYDTAAFANRTK